MKQSVADKILSDVPDVYDQIADHFSLTRNELWNELEAFRGRVLPKQKVLDAGCGNGRLMKLFEGIDCQYVGVDNSAKLLAKAQQASSGFASLHPSFVEGSLLSLPFPDNSFDHVFCIAAFHHIPSKKFQLQGAKELYRVLRPGGSLVMTNWDLRHQWRYVAQQLRLRFTMPKLFFGSAFFDFFIPWTRGQQTFYRYYRAFSQKELEGILSKAGFNSCVSVSTPQAQKRNICITAVKNLS